MCFDFYVVTIQAPAGSQATTKKVFVGGIATQTKEEDVRAYFSQFGTVSHVKSHSRGHNLLDSSLVGD